MELINKEETQTFFQQLHQDQTKLGITKPQTAREIVQRYTQPAPNKQGRAKLTPTDRQEYADDAVLFMESQNQQNTTTYLRNYSNVAKSRQIPIRWKKTEMLTMGKITPDIHKLPPPYNNIEYRNEGNVLGKLINVGNKQLPSIKHRIKSAKEIWRKTRAKISQNPNT